MVGGLNLERGLGLTGVVVVDEFKSLEGENKETELA